MDRRTLDVERLRRLRRNAEVVETLKEWRLAESKKRRIPAFRVMRDRTLLALAGARPGSEDELLEVPGIGARIVERYGEELIRLLS